MANENLLGIQKQREISESGSGIFSDAGFREVPEAKKTVAMESLKSEFVNILDKLKKMDEIIEDINTWLCKSNQEFDESMGI
jgi:predicted mannosyl-3-phosphoglycerate phosphatase (HAD superfamily)